MILPDFSPIFYLHVYPKNGTFSNTDTQHLQSVFILHNNKSHWRIAKQIPPTYLPTAGTKQNHDMRCIKKKQKSRKMIAHVKPLL